MHIAVSDVSEVEPSSPSLTIQINTLYKIIFYIKITFYKENLILHGYSFVPNSYPSIS